jgi:hypothetical protein
MFPDRLVPRTKRKNEDYYSNRKAQAWWHCRMLFQESFKASRGEPFDREAFISINPKIPELSRLIAELSQATVTQSATGKLQIDKLGEGERSPNLADAIVIAYAPRKMPMKISLMFGRVSHGHSCHPRSCSRWIGKPFLLCRAAMSGEPPRVSGGACGGVSPCFGGIEYGDCQSQRTRRSLTRRTRLR